MIVTTTDGVEVWVSQFPDDDPEAPVYVAEAEAAYWRETDKPTVEAAAKWVAARTWDEVKQGCL